MGGVRDLGGGGGEEHEVRVLKGWEVQVLNNLQSGKRADERKGRKKVRNPEMQGTRGGRGLDPLRLPHHGAS